MPILLVIIGFYHVAHDRCGGSAAPSSGLNEGRHDDIRITPWRVAYEPSIFLQFLAEFILQLEAFSLRGAGFAGEVDVLKLDQAGSCAVRLIDDAPQDRKSVV